MFNIVAAPRKNVSLEPGPARTDQLKKNDRKSPLANIIRQNQDDYSRFVRKKKFIVIFIFAEKYPGYL